MSRAGGGYLEVGAGEQINGDSPGQHEMTEPLCKLRSSDTAPDGEEREGVTQPSCWQLPVCLVNTRCLRWSWKVCG